MKEIFMKKIFKRNCMKNGKIILKVKSGKLVNKKLKIRKKYKIVLKQLDENSKIDIYN